MNGADSDREPSPYLLNTDGGIDAEPGQPEGHASIGVVLTAPDGSLVHEVSAGIGWTRDHHVAEYEALITGLRLALGHGVLRIRVLLDSRLVVNQVNGDFKTGAEHLKPLWMSTHALMREFSNIKVLWVPRKQNGEADTLADRALQPRQWGSKGS